MDDQERSRLRARYGITVEDEANYELPEEKDLTADDNKTVSLILSQLLSDWRDPLIEKLDLLLKKYS